MKTHTARPAPDALGPAVEPALCPDSGWVWPYWLERQLDPASPAFVPRGEVPLVVNTTARNWTTVGNLDSPGQARVDARGLVTPRAGGWSLDWWVGADDRWHLPSREVGVRQRLLDGAPVVETAMRVPSGDVVHRVYAGLRSSPEGGGDLVVIEVENSSKVPVALAFAVRPYHQTGIGRAEHIDMDGDTVVVVDGRPAVVLPKPPSRVAASVRREGDSAETVLAGDAAEEWPGAVRCGEGLAQAAFVYPLPHGTTLRVVVPAVPGPVRKRAPAPTFPAVLPAAADVARGWKAQGDRGMRLVLPDDRWAEAVEANRRHLMLACAQVAVDDGFRDTALLTSALGLYGLHDEVARALVSYPDRQRLDGTFGHGANQSATGAALWALGRHWQLSRDRELVEPMVGPIAKAVHRIEKARTAPRRAGPAPGLLPPGEALDHLGPTERYYVDDLWALAGMEAAAELLAGVDQPEAAADAARFAVELRRALDAAWAADAERLGRPVIPSGPERGLDPGMVGPLVACSLLGLPAADDKRVVSSAAFVRERFSAGASDAFYLGIGSSGLSPHLTMQLAGVELAAGDPRCLARLGWLLDTASPTWTWPEAMHPRLSGGCRGSGQHPLAAAELLRFVRNLMVTEGPSGPAMATLVPDTWLGQGWEVHDAPTRFGVFSYAVRWHGERPALLWDLQPHADGSGGQDAGFVMTAPGLDQGWSSTELKGEALLSPIPPRPAAD